ncbi:hypothetical protein DM77_3707 [Burkholderia mallei]|nr:hypothetical protein DM77_3707 [Burkholderia mallei]
MRRNIGQPRTLLPLSRSWFKGTLLEAHWPYRRGQVKLTKAEEHNMNKLIAALVAGLFATAAFAQASAPAAASAPAEKAEAASAPAKKAHAKKHHAKKHAKKAKEASAAEAPAAASN